MALRTRMLAVSFIAALAAAPGAAGHAATLERRIKAGSEKVEQGDCRGSLKHWDAALGDKDFPSLPDHGKAAIYQIAASCAALSDQEERAYRYALDGTNLTAGTELLWSERLTIELASAREAQAVETTEAVARRNPDALNAMPIRRFLQLERRASADPELQARLLRVLVAPSYQPEDIFGAADIFKRKYAVMLADAGDTSAALELTRLISAPSELLKVSTDPRLRPALPVDFDGRAETEQSLAKARAFAAAHPRSLAAVVRVAELERMLGRPEEALATLLATRPDQPQQAPFSDEYVNWWWDGVAKSYQILGRYDDAERALRRGVATEEYGLLNVSQRLNLGSAQWRFGRPAEALATISPIDKRPEEVSPYGKMVLRVVRGCSQMALGRIQEARADLDYAAAHEEDHPEALTSLQLCAGDLDGAAQTLIRRLDDPTRRAEALLLLSEFDPPRSTYPMAPDDSRLPDIKARTDVQAAAARAGRVQRYRLQGAR